jgi:hypothetical protein
MAKLTGSIMVPSAEVNPTRPMPPGSRRSKHSAGLSVRRLCSQAADPEAGDSRRGEELTASRLFAGPFTVVICSRLLYPRDVSFPQAPLAVSAGAAARGPGRAGRSFLERYP